MNVLSRWVSASLIAALMSLAVYPAAYASTEQYMMQQPFPSAVTATSVRTGYRALDKYQFAELPPGNGQVVVPSSYSPVPSVGSYGTEFFPDLLGGSKKIFSGENLTLALVGGSLAALAANVDHVDRNTKTYFQTRRPMDRVSKYGDIIGQGYYHAGLGAALFAAGELSDNKKLADTGIVVLEAFLVNGLATEALKYSTNRLRPNGGDHLSFPSGHASSTAAVAASISEMYDWDLRIAVPLYATVVFVGASRIQDNAHYLSDVIAGVTLGTLVGTSFAKYRKEKDKGVKVGRNLSFSPILEKNLKGGIFTMKW